MKISIYGLVDPETKEIRYIGRTKQKLSVRKAQHICNSKSNHGTYKKHWISKLVANNKKPEIVLLKELNCSWEDSHLIELKIIKEFVEFNGGKIRVESTEGKGTQISFSLELLEQEIVK